MQTCKSWNMLYILRKTDLPQGMRAERYPAPFTPIHCVPASQRSNSQIHCFNYLVILPELSSFFLCLLLSLSVTLKLPSKYWFKIKGVRHSLQLSQNDSYVYWEACKAQSDTVAATATLLLLPSYSALLNKVIWMIYIFLYLHIASDSLLL